MQNFFEHKNVLIIGAPQVIRSTLKKVFFELGSDLSHIEFFEGSSQEAIERLLESNAEIVMTPTKLEQKTALDFFKLHSQIYPNRLDSAFFVLSFKGQKDYDFLPLDYDIDGILQLPASKEKMNSEILRSLSQKISPTSFEYEKKNIETLIKKNKISEAVGLIDALFMFENSQFEEVFFLKGLCSFKLKEYEQALEFFNDSLEIAPQHYKSLSGKSAVLIKQGEWKEAYDINQKLLQLFPLDPNRIPTFMKVALINKKYDDCLTLYELYKEVDERDPKTLKKIAAILALTGKHLLEKEDETKGLSVIEKSASISRGSLEITHTLVSSLLENRSYAQAYDTLYKVHQELQGSTKFKFIELELLSQSENFVHEALVIGLELLQQKHRPLTLYETVLALSQKLQRKPASIREIVDDASRKYPRHSEYFRSYIN